MRLVVRFGLLAAAGVLFGPPAADAAHCGLCRYPAPCVAAAQCCPPVVTARVCYQPATEQQTQVCYPPGYKTCYTPTTETCYPTVSDQQCEATPYTVTKPVVKS